MNIQQLDREIKNDIKSQRHHFEDENIMQQEELKSNNMKKRFMKLENKIKKVKTKESQNIFNEESSQVINEESQNIYISNEAFREIQRLTKNFDLTFKKIEKKQELKQHPLKEIPKEDIQYVIRKARQNLKRKGGLDLDNEGKKYSIRISQKRIISYPKEDSESECFSNYSEKTKEIEQKTQYSIYNELAKSLIIDFQNQTQKTQNLIIDQVSMLINNDKNILMLSINQQVEENLNECTLLAKERRNLELKERLDKISPMSSVLLIIKISHSLPNLLEEGYTLVNTFVPYLNQCQDFSFIPQQQSPLCTRIIHTLVQYYQDSKDCITIGLTKFALQYGPHILQPVIRNKADMDQLQTALIEKGFTQTCSKIMSQKPLNFLWNDMLFMLKSKKQNEQQELIEIFSKLKILQNPCDNIEIILDLLYKRRIFIIRLLEFEEIPLTLSLLIQVLDNLKGQNAETIEQCFSQDIQSWIINSNKFLNQEQNKENELTEEEVLMFFENQKINLNQSKLINLEDMFEVSKKVEKRCQNYQHNLYQAAISSIIVSQIQNHIIIEMPTASGKTWIQAIIALFFTSQNKKVTLIEPNMQLKIQTEEHLNDLNMDLSFMTIDEFYEYPPQDEILIINEYDSIIRNNAFKSVINGITGLWQFQNRKAFYFSASSDRNCEKIIRNFFQDFKVLKFQSEYEMVQKSSNLSQGQIKTFIKSNILLEELEKDISKFYTEKPIIIFYDKLQESDIIDILNRNQWNKFKIGFNQEIKKEIRQWFYGILLLQSEDAVGIDCKFQKDSIVLITTLMRNEAQYIQVQGRSSRARGLCNSVYYLVSQESQFQILKNLKHQQSHEMQELERLIKVIWYKRDQKGLQDVLEDFQKTDDYLKNLKDLEQLLGAVKYKKLVKGIQF